MTTRTQAGQTTEGGQWGARILLDLTSFPKGPVNLKYKATTQVLRGRTHGGAARV